MIYLKHPEHGIKVAYLESEIEADKKNGWTEVSETEKPAVETALDEEEKTLRELYAEKFGKAPHHRMKPETIAKALQEENHDHGPGTD